MSDIYLHTVDVYVRGLDAISGWFNKAKTYADAKKFEVDTLVTARLAPDMFPFAKQVQLTCDCASGQAALLCGKEVPKYEGTEKTFAELRQRVELTLNYLATFKRDDFEGCEDRRISLPVGEGNWMVGREFVDQIAMPNFFFHATMAYAILRHNGVDLGKRDFIGDVRVRQG